MSTDGLTVGEVARRAGVAVSALHYWEGLGLIRATRSTGNQRRYPRHMLRRVALLRMARTLGVPLAEVRDAFAELPEESAPTRQQWERVSSRWRADLEARRRMIERLEAELTGCIGCGCLSMERCGLLNPGDRLGDIGSGPRRILDDPSG